MPRQQDKTLECRSCRGDLLPDRYVDTEDACGHMWVRMLRCVDCGKIPNVVPPRRTKLLQFSPFGKTAPRNILADESTPLGI
ncbi:MAG: hypothetical protein ABW047_07040 [Nitrospiraceae bacterium]